MYVGGGEQEKKLKAEWVGMVYDHINCYHNGGHIKEICLLKACPMLKEGWVGKGSIGKIPQ